VGQMLRQIWGLCGKIICTKAVLLIIRVYVIWINLRSERTCYLIYWTALIHFAYEFEFVLVWANFLENVGASTSHNPATGVALPYLTLMLFYVKI
jgi:hypothetical protein